MRIESSAPRGANLIERVRRLVLTAETPDEERQLALLGCTLSEGGKIACTSAKGGTCYCRECLDSREQHLEPWDRTAAKFMTVCSQCRNKRCPHAASHRYACTGSNEPGQVGVPLTSAREDDPHA